MGERNDAERSVREARERLTEVALELSRRASGDYVKAVAREKAEEQMTRAKVMARERTTEMKDRLLDSPWALGFIGGVVGTVAGRMIGAKAKESREDTTYRRGTLPYDEYTATHRMGASVGYAGGYGSQYGQSQGYYSNPYQQGYDDTTGGSWAGGYHSSGYQEGDLGTSGANFDEGQREGGGLKQKAHEAKQKAHDAKDRIREGVGHLKENIQSRTHGDGSHPGLKDRAQELRGRAGHAFSSARDHIPGREDLREKAHAVRHNADDHPGIWALAALAAGAFVGALMPVTDKERQALAPIKARASEGLHGLQSQAREKVQAVASDVKDKAQSVADVAGVGSFIGGSKESSKEASDSGFGSDIGSNSPAFGNDAWSQKPAPTYHASNEGGSFGPNVEPEVERTSPEGGYGGGSVGEDESKGWSAASSSDEDEGSRTIIANPDDDNLTRH